MSKVYDIGEDNSSCKKINNEEDISDKNKNIQNNIRGNLTKFNDFNSNTKIEKENINPLASNRDNLNNNNEQIEMNRWNEDGNQFTFNQSNFNEDTEKKNQKDKKIKEANTTNKKEKERTIKEANCNIKKKNKKVEQKFIFIDKKAEIKTYLKERDLGKKGAIPLNIQIDNNSPIEKNVRSSFSSPRYKVRRNNIKKNFTYDKIKEKNNFFKEFKRFQIVQLKGKIKVIETDRKTIIQNYSGAKTPKNMKPLQEIQDTNCKKHFDYYNECKSNRNQTCYGCLFGNNNNLKGYSPLLCCPNKDYYAKLGYLALSSSKKKNKESYVKN